MVMSLNAEFHNSRKPAHIVCTYFRNQSAVENVKRGGARCEKSDALCYDWHKKLRSTTSVPSKVFSTCHQGQCLRMRHLQLPTSTTQRNARTL